ncbi:MAG: radical SAM protein [Methanothrix sp.]|nr:radical SAM protein [Methanothrix sp.]
MRRSALALKALWQMRVRGRPFVLSHGITSRCNLSCSFCEHWRAPGKEMGTQEIKQMLTEARAFGIRVYNAWTAEPLLRSDLPEILSHAKGLGLITSIITNGHLLKERIQELEDLDLLSVSVDGVESYREIRGRDLEGVLEGVRAAREAGHDVLMNCVINGRNLDELDGLVDLAASLGASISFEPIHESPRIDREVWDALGISDMAAYRRALDRLIARKRKGDPIINSLTYLGMVRSKRPGFRCHVGDMIMHVSSDGTVQACRVHSEPLFNASDGLDSGWRASREMRKRITQECQGCLFFGYAENSMLYDLVPEVMLHYRWM